MTLINDDNDEEDWWNSGSWEWNIPIRGLGAVEKLLEKEKDKTYKYADSVIIE